MDRKRLREEWNTVPDRGMLPDEVKSRMWKNIRKATINKRTPLYRYVAAACAILFLSFISYQYLLKPDSYSPQVVATKTYLNDIRLIRLPDGTKVWVNQNTEIEYPAEFSADERTVVLKGEAFFEVEKDPSRPFIISSENITTTVLGTSFNIKAYHGHAPQVDVRTGKVKVESENNTVYLERGDAAVYMSTSESVKKQKALVLEPQWKKALIDVDGLTLEQVVSQLRTNHEFILEYDTAQLKHLKIKGTLDARHGLTEMLETIAFALNIQILPKGKNEYLVIE